MEPFYITSENTEDRFGCADNLEEAVRIAREWARTGEAGGPVNIEYRGMNIRQFVLRANGKITEAVLADGSPA